jgi:hypothetical protein
MVLSQVPDKPSAGIPTGKKGGARWIWFVLPALALAGVGGFIGWDVYKDKQQRDARATATEEAEQINEEPTPEVKVAPEPTPPPPEVVVPPEDPAPKVEPKKKAPPPSVKTIKASASPGEAAMRLLQADFEKLIDESVQRKFRLQLSALEGQVGEKGNDAAFVRKVEALHEQVKTALSKQQ